MTWRSGRRADARPAVSRPVKKFLVLTAAVSLAVLYGIGFLAANDWRIPAAGMTQAMPAVVEPEYFAGGFAGAQSDDGQPSQPTGGADLASPSTPRASPRYRDIREPATLTLAELASVYELDSLPNAAGHLVMNHRTRVIVEDLVLALPRDVTGRSRGHFEQAVELHFGRQVAAEFSGVLDGFLRYRKALAAIDGERNARGAVPGDAGEDDALRQRLQDDAFGSKNASELFRVERATLAVMAAQAAQAGAAGPALTPDVPVR